MSVPPGDYAPTQVPTVFVEMPQSPPPPPPREDKGGVMISRGFLAVLTVLLLGALIATTVGLLMLRDTEQASAAEVVKQRDQAVKRVGELETANSALSESVKAANAKVEKYGAIEYQLGLIRDKTAEIQTLRKAKPSYPASQYMDLSKIPEWSKPGEKLLQDFVVLMDAERAKLIEFREPPRRDPGPADPVITAAPG